MICFNESYIFLFQFKDGSSESVVVKVFEDEATELGVNTKKEVEYWKLLRKSGYGAALLATFEVRV